MSGVFDNNPELEFSKFAFSLIAPPPVGRYNYIAVDCTLITAPIVTTSIITTPIITTPITTPKITTPTFTTPRVTITQS
jgi:hypothetical protein